MSWFDLTSIFFLGLLGSGHCVGMCGGFALALSEPASGWRNLLFRHLLYHTGKGMTYVFLAGLVAAGSAVVARSEWFSVMQIGLAVMVGFFMITYGLSQFFEWRLLSRLEHLGGQASFCQSMSALLRCKSAWAALPLGWMNSFLPCGLVLAVLFYLASFRSVFWAMIGAAVFAASTFPGLFLLGSTTRLWKVENRRRLVRWMGLLIVLFGLFTLVRWIPSVHHWFHENLLIEVKQILPEWCRPD
ncbi:MAG: sulfite exporter TauE/SafE family protein [Opitutaceae bacterium]|nr:sulfite exporter TauE/SafE family protein [Opitutaceae bacterium]